MSWTEPLETTRGNLRRKWSEAALTIGSQLEPILLRALDRASAIGGAEPITACCRPAAYRLPITPPKANNRLPIDCVCCPPITPRAAQQCAALAWARARSGQLLLATVTQSRGAIESVADPARSVPTPFAQHALAPFSRCPKCCPFRTRFLPRKGRSRLPAQSSPETASACGPQWGSCGRRIPRARFDIHFLLTRLRLPRKGAAAP